MKINRTRSIECFIIIVLSIINIYLYITKAIPGALSDSIDLRYGRVLDLINHQWAGLEEYPSMIFCLLPIAIFPDIQAAKIGWLCMNFIFMAIIIACFRKTFLKELNLYLFIIVSLLFISSVPVIITYKNGQNLLFAYAFFMMSYSMNREMNDETTRKLGIAVLAGILLGISFFKYSTIFFLLPLFIYLRRYTEIIVSILMHLILTIFSVFWLEMPLKEIILLPIASSIETNAGRGFIDLMTICNSDLLSIFPGGGHIVDVLNSCGNIVYYTLLLLGMTCILYISIFGKNCDIKTVYSLFCSLSVVLIYHRLYDYFVLIVPFVYCVHLLYKSINEKRRLPIIINGISVLGIVFIMWGNWIFNILGFTIDSKGINQIYYGVCIIGLYTLCVNLLIMLFKQMRK